MISDNFEQCVSQIKNKVIIGSINNGDPTVISNIIDSFNAGGFHVTTITLCYDQYQDYVNKANYKRLYPQYYVDNFHEKTLEHFLSAINLSLRPGDVFIDVASEHSPIYEIYHRLYGVTSYRQDIMYPKGLNGNTIGGDACNMPISDDFADKIALTCSLEHFENDSDSGLIKEFNRVLKPGGIAYIVPFYLFNTYAIQTDPTISVPNNVNFDSNAVIYCCKGWGNRHGRFYDFHAFLERIVPYLDRLVPEIQYISNPYDIHSSCYCRFALKLTKR